VKIVIGADHAGLELKEQVKRFLEGSGYEVVDVGTHSAESVDYPDYAREVAGAVARGRFSRGILVCATGLGMCMAANRFAAVRAAAPRTEYEAEMTRADNDSNVLCLGGRVQAPALALAITKRWLDAPYVGGRHQRRVEKMGDPNFTAEQIDAPKPH
jgi:ribose 5-phosphate isomerase B